jgi:hypothetical protein
MLTHIEIIVHSHHGRIAASTLAFHLYNSEFSVFSGLTRVKATEMLSDGIKDFRGSLKHTGCRGADLHKIGPYWLSGNSIHPVRRIPKYNGGVGYEMHRLNIV